jgi:hypothetical protein
MICSLHARAARFVLLPLFYPAVVTGISKGDVSGQILSDGQISHVPLLRREKSDKQEVDVVALKGSPTAHAERASALIEDDEQVSGTWRGSPVYTIVNRNQDCQPSTDWLGAIGMDKCSSSCRVKGYSFFLNAPDNNCKCCSAGYKLNNNQNFNVYRTATYTLLDKDQDCQPSTDWIGAIGMDKCASTCQGRGYSYFLNAPDNNCKCCSVGYKLNNNKHFNVYHTGPYRLENKDQDCQPSTDWIGNIGMDACSSTCQGRGYSYFLNAPDNNCKCCSAGYKTNGNKNFNVYRSAILVAYARINKDQDCQPSTDWYGAIGKDKCSSTCQGQGYSFFLNAPDNNCKCCMNFYKTNDKKDFDVYLIAR